MVFARTNKLRTRPEITSAFSISSSGRLWPFLNREILNVGSLRFRSRSIDHDQIQPKSERIPSKLISGRVLRFVISFAGVLLLLHLGANSSQAQDQGSVLGELELEGKSIVRLVLRREGDNEREEFRRPEQITKLPTGKYAVQEVHLDGGYIYYASRGPRRRLVSVTSDEPATLKIGGPLKQTVKVNRQGRLLVMNYELLGVDGEQYTDGTSGEPPTFTIYRGDKEIISDKFEFG